VVYKTDKVPKLVTGDSNKVGLRIPAHRTILALIRAVGPLVATSANLAEEKPALSAKAAKKALPQLDYYLPGRVKSGQASKVIDLTTKLKILRH
jgi:tRNA A37 threonylcarbamoyladenosine synthetase subunit TsaC/SUA5/YrdC